jgi:DNA invertase Pin-like site-specific DNA recombinase
MNVLHPNKKASIITLLTNGVSQREIGRKVRVDRKTIRKYASVIENDNQIGDESSKSPGVATGISGHNA